MYRDVTIDGVRYMREVVSEENDYVPEVVRVGWRVVYLDARLPGWCTVMLGRRYYIHNDGPDKHYTYRVEECYGPYASKRAALAAMQILASLEGDVQTVAHEGDSHGH